MGSRTYNTVVVLFWLSTMVWLLVAKVIPDLRKGDPPNHLAAAKQRSVELAEAMIDGELAYRRGEFDKAFEHLREAVRRDDALNYDEPWGWMQPTRHALGALLLEQGRHAEAEAVYRTDLKKHPNNPWALHGLSECLKQQGKQDEKNEG